MSDEPAHLFKLLSHTADGAFVIGENQRILFWNTAAQELLGYTAAEVLGRPCCEVLKGRDEQGFLFCRFQCGVVQSTAAGDNLPNFDMWVRARSGKRRWVNLSILAAPQEQSPPLIVHLIRDASEKRRNAEVIEQVSVAMSLLQGPNVVTELWQALSRPDEVELSDREREVLSLLAQGLNTADIAQALTISVATTRNHVQNILNKLHVHSRLQAVAYALEHHLIGNE
ncbi:MAG: LuxR C-terminal-related transcriptional regulator [Chloroflexota bacterium]